MAFERGKRAQEKLDDLTRQQKSIGAQRAQIEAKIEEIRKRKLCHIEEEDKNVSLQMQKYARLIETASWEMNHPYFTTLENVLQLHNLVNMVCEYMSTKYCGDCQRMVPRSIGCLLCESDRGTEITYITCGNATMSGKSIIFTHPHDIEFEQEVQWFSCQKIPKPLHVHHSVETDENDNYIEQPLAANSEIIVQLPTDEMIVECDIIVPSKQVQTSESEEDTSDSEDEEWFPAIHT